MPVSVGGTLFNVPTSAIRRKIQRHSGPQERVDLSFIFPSLEPPEAPKHVSADTVEEKVQPIDRIFLSISAHHDSLAPDMRVRTIYPRYLEQASTPVDDGLTMRAFRDGSPYANEDLFSASAPGLNARCTRDGLTPGMCLSERRVDGADLTFRFPRSWLSQWRDVANAMERLTAQLQRAEGLAPSACVGWAKARCAVPTINPSDSDKIVVGTLALCPPYGTSAARASPDVGQIFLEDRHLELERAIVVLVIDEQHADELLADIDLGGVVLLRPRHDADLGIAEYALEIGVELPDFLNVHGGLQSDHMWFPGGF